MDQLQSSDGVLPGPPQHISSSPGINTPAESWLSDDLHQPLELIPNASAFQTNIDCPQSNSVLPTDLEFRNGPFLQDFGSIFEAPKYSNRKNDSRIAIDCESASNGLDRGFGSTCPPNMSKAQKSLQPLCPFNRAVFSQKLGIGPGSRSQIPDISMQNVDVREYSRQLSPLDTASPAPDVADKPPCEEDPALQSSCLSPSSLGFDTQRGSEFNNNHAKLIELVQSSSDIAVPEQVLRFSGSVLDKRDLAPGVSIIGIPAVQPQLSNFCNQSDAFPAVSSHSGDDDEEISALEYARMNCLSRDYLKEPYLISTLDVFGDYRNRLTDDSHLPQFEMKTNINADERLTITRDAALLIASVTREEPHEWVEYSVLGSMIGRRHKFSRLELPLLKTDNETDCEQFAQRDGFEAKLQNVKLPSEIVDEENSGGLVFSPSLWRKGTEILDGLKREKLEVSRDTVVFLQTIHNIDWTQEDEEQLWKGLHTYSKSTALAPVTPPLSPMISPVQRWEPSMSDPAFELPILSDPASITKYDLDAIESELFKEDVPTPIKNARERNKESSETLAGSYTVQMADIYSPAAFLDQSPVSPPTQTTRFKREELKVEEPLTPAKSSEHQKALGFSDIVCEWPLMDVPAPTNPMQSSYFEEAFGEAHKKANRMSEQETLIPADTTARVDVPLLDFTLPVPPWKISNSSINSGSVKDKYNVLIKDTIDLCIPKWPLNGKLKVRYNPFPHDLAKVNFEDVFFTDDSTWRAFVTIPEDNEVIDISAVTWKPPGLRILRDDEDDDELQPANFEGGSHQDISYLARKRKIEIEERGSGSGRTTETLEIAFAKQQLKKKTLWQIGFASKATKLQTDLSGNEKCLLLGDGFSVGNSVDNFLEIRGAKRPKLGDSSYFTKAPIPKAKLTLPKPNTPPEPQVQLPMRNSPIFKDVIALPAPTSKVLNTPLNIIIASTLLKHRALIKNIEALFPGIILLERDFSAHDKTAWMPGSVARSPIASPLASEADMIVSPLVGIIITNLQKIKQKPLPGQKTTPAIRGRLEKVSARYEKIIVFVTEGRPDETTVGLDDSDCAAISEFVAFASFLQSNINVYFVGGGEATLAKWIANVISEHKVGEELLPEETHWELFLRRTGLNAFAAQSIIGALKAPDSISPSSPSKAAEFGLAAFVTMSTETRIARFGQICGNQIIEKVSAVIDAKWS